MSDPSKRLAWVLGLATVMTVLTAAVLMGLRP